MPPAPHHAEERSPPERAERVTARAARRRERVLAEGGEAPDAKRGGGAATGRPTRDPSGTESGDPAPEGCTMISANACSGEAMTPMRVAAAAESARSMERASKPGEA